MVWSLLTRRKSELLLSCVGLTFTAGCIFSPTQQTLEPATPEPETPDETESQPAEAKKKYRLKESFAIQDEETDIVVTFSEYRTHEGEEFLKPKEGHYWYFLKGTVRNRSDNPFLISPDFYTLVDAKKETYTPSYRAHALEGIMVLQGRIPAQTTKTAEIGFELPEGTKPASLKFNISNFTACNDSILKTLYFCQAISVQLSDGRG